MDQGMDQEHSGARLERFLQLCGEDPDVLPNEDELLPMHQLQDTNMIVVNCTTPANIHHLYLRRQIINLNVTFKFL